MAISPITKGLNKVIESRWMTKKFQEGLKDPPGFAAKAMVLSFITKDAVNCAIYTYQSANNQKIPEDKRAFVASLDLIQGFINVGGQLLTASIVDKQLTPKWFAKFYSGAGEETSEKARLSADNLRGLVKDIITDNHEGANKNTITKVKNILKDKNIDLKKITPKEAENVVQNLVGNMAEGSKNFKLYHAGFKLLVTALATTALVKRTLNPLISTPLAGMLSDYVDNRKKKMVDDRMDYEFDALQAGKFNKFNKIDKTAFSSVSSRNN